MNRYPNGQQDGDLGWQGVDMFHDRAIVQQGFLSRSENKRLRDGPATTRPGTTFPADFNADFTNVIIGSGIYSNPNGDEVMLVATKDETYVWQLQYNKDPKKILLFDPTPPVNDPPPVPNPIPAITTKQKTGTGFVNFVQAFDKVMLLRAPIGSQPVLIWDGDPAHKFVPIGLQPDGLKIIPPTWFGEPFENRVLYYSPYLPTPTLRTQFVMSDILDPTSYDNIYSVLNINAAGADHIVRLVGWQKGALIAVLRHSIHMLEDFTVDPNQTTQRVLSNSVGGVGFKMPLLVGRELFFLSEPGGFYKVSQVIQDEISAEPIPISRAIQPVVDRINFNQAHVYGCSASLGDYAYFAVPLDTVTGGNNAIVVLNTVTGQWESAPDSWNDPLFKINALHVTLHEGSRKLFGLDYAASKVYVLYDGLADNINGEFVAVRDVIETRGYVCGDPGGVKKFERVTMGLRTSEPFATVTALTDGVNEEYELATLTKDRLKFYLHGHKAFDPLTDNPNEPKREDYSIPDQEVSALEDFENLPVGLITLVPGTEFNVGDVKRQESLERYLIRQAGRWISLRVENSSGQCDILGIAVDGTSVGETIKTVA